jgi:MFS family permease
MPFRLTPIVPVLLGVVCAQIALGIMTTLIPLLLLRAGVGTQTVGIVASAYFAGFLVGALIADRIVARAGHVRAFAAFAAIAADAALFMPFFTAPWLWAVLRVCIGYAASGLFLVAESWLNDRSDAATRGRTFGAYLVASWGGAAAGPLVLNGVEGSALLFVVVGLAFSTALLPMALTDQPNPALGERHFLWLHRLFAISPLGVTCCMASGLCNSAFYALMPVYLTHRGYGAGAIPLFLSVATAAGLFVQYPIGIASDRLGRRRVMLASIGIAFLLALALAKTSGTALWLAIAIGAGFAGVTAPLYGLGAGQTNDHASREDLVGVSGGLLFAWSVGSSIGPTVAGTVMSVVGPGGLFLYLAGVLGLVGLVTLARMAVRGVVPLRMRHGFVPSLSWPARLPELMPRRRPP